MSIRHSVPGNSMLSRSCFACALALGAIVSVTLATAPSAVLAQKNGKASKPAAKKAPEKPDATKADAPAKTQLNIQLNKLETVEKNCRAYFVVDNTGSTAFKALKLDLVLFQPNGVIGGRFAVDLGPLRAKKKSVRLFDLEDVTCDKTGSLLLNDVMECVADGKDAKPPNCLDDISLSSKADAMLTR